MLPSVQMVRFSQSFDEDDSPEDDMRRLSSKPPLAPSGGSVSLAAQHFCPVCGIIATSQDNLEVPPHFLLPCMLPELSMSPALLKALTPFSRMSLRRALHASLLRQL